MCFIQLTILQPRKKIVRFFTFWRGYGCALFAEKIITQRKNLFAVFGFALLQ